MKPILVKDNVFRLSLNVKNLLFEEMWVIPKGVTLNSYIVKGEKLAIIDGFCGWDGVPEELYKLLNQLDITMDKLDYIIINHTEPDHSGWIEDVRNLKPDVKIFCTKLAATMLKDFFGITDNVHVIKNGDSLDLGAGKVLEFYPTPNTHWPDTMVTFEKSTKTLFTCDMFGTYGVCEGNDFDDDFNQADQSYFYDEAIRYYSNVLVTFNDAVKKAIAKAKDLTPKIIAPGHGPVWREDANKIIKIYEDITGFTTGAPLDEVLVLWGSMYGMTEKAVKHVEHYLDSEHVRYHSLRVPETPIGTVMMHALKAKTILIIAPTYENHLFPIMSNTLEELGKKKVMGKKSMYIGSYGWAGGGEKEYNAIIERYKFDWEVFPAITFKGKPLKESLENIETALANLI